VSWRPRLEDRVLRQMQGLPSEAFDMLVRTLARICDDPYDPVFSVPVPPVPGRRVADLGDFGFSSSIRLEPSPYHPWGLSWSGADPEFTHAVGVDTSASPSLEEVMPVRRHHQQAVRETLENLTDAGLAEVRAAP